MRNPAVAMICERAWARSTFLCCLSLLTAAALGLTGEPLLAGLLGSLAAFCAGAAFQAVRIGMRFE